MTYKDINVRKFMKLQEVLEDNDYDELHLQSCLIAIIEDMTEDEVLQLKLNEYSRKAQELNFLTAQPNIPNRCPDKLVLGGEKYVLVKDVRKLSAGQFIDFETLMGEKNRDKYLPNILACFVIPEGKEYGDYDVMEVADKIADYMSAEEALMICNFFQKQSLVFTKLTLRYLERRLKKEMRKEKNPETKEKLKEAITNLNQYKGLFKDGIGSIG